MVDKHPFDETKIEEIKSLPRLNL